MRYVEIGILCDNLVVWCDVSDESRRPDVD